MSQTLTPALSLIMRTAKSNFAAGRGSTTRDLAARARSRRTAQATNWAAPAKPANISSLAPPAAQDFAKEIMRGEGWGEGQSATEEHPMQRTLEQTQFTRPLRSKSTYAERIVWIMLHDRELGSFKFRRQHPLNFFDAEFFSTR